MVTRILVPMDDSEHAAQALTHALENYPDAEITVLHVVGVPSMMMGEATALSLEDDIESAARERANAVFERAQELADEYGRTVSTTVGIGHPARVIIKRSDEYDLVILGSHGADWQRAAHRFLIGNVATAVVKRAPVPVLVVR